MLARDSKLKKKQGKKLWNIEARVASASYYVIMYMLVSRLRGKVAS